MALSSAISVAPVLKNNSPHWPVSFHPKLPSFVMKSFGSTAFPLLILQIRTAAEERGPVHG
jgi:hypothetical protein